MKIFKVALFSALMIGSITPMVSAYSMHDAKEFCKKHEKQISTGFTIFCLASAITTVVVGGGALVAVGLSENGSVPVKSQLFPNNRNQT